MRQAQILGAIITSLWLVCLPVAAGDTASRLQVVRTVLVAVRKGHCREAEALLFAMVVEEDPGAKSLHKVAAELNNLGARYFDARDLKMAKNCFVCAIDADEQLKPVDVASTAADRNGLASVYLAQRKYDLAAEEFERVLKIIEQEPLAIGKDNATTVLENYESLLHTVGKEQRALEVQRLLDSYAQRRDTQPAQ